MHALNIKRKKYQGEVLFDLRIYLNMWTDKQKLFTPFSSFAGGQDEPVIVSSQYSDSTTLMYEYALLGVRDLISSYVDVFTFIIFEHAKDNSLILVKWTYMKVKGIKLQ